MDYDDNDFQSQNLRLNGEGSTEISPVIRPFALPKFDFDDSLQGHLRFDSLVETEVFLGIESQEDNHWIEDFSRASSGIEFSPRAAETCSISRRNNVWSEATSSESVEMLLKSVGQEELILGQTIEESDMLDEQGNLTKEMEPTLKQDDSTLPVADIVDPGPTFPSGMILGSFPRQNEDVGENPMQIDNAVQTCEGESSGYKNPSNFDPRTASEKCGLPVMEGSMLDDSKSNDVNHTEVGLSVHDFPVSRAEHLSATEVQANNCLIVGNLVTSSQNVITSIEVASSRVSNEKADNLQIENCDVGEESHVQSSKTLLDGRSLGVDAVESRNNNIENAIGAMSGVDSILEGNVVEIIRKDMEEPSAIMQEESDLQMAEGCRVDVCVRIPVQASKCQVMGLCSDKERDDHYEEDTKDDLSVALEGDSRSDEQDHELCDSNVGNCASLELNIYSDKQCSESGIDGKNRNLLESGHQMGTEILVSNSEASLMSVEYCKVLNCQSAESGVIHVEHDPHSTLACPSPELSGRTHEAENLKDLHESSGVCRKGTTLDEAPLCEKNDVSGQTYVHSYGRDDSVIRKGKAELLIDVSNVECPGVGPIDTDGMLGSSSFASGMALEEGVPLMPQDGVANDEAIDSKFNEKLPSLVVSSLNLDTNEGTGTLMSTKSSSSTLNVCSEEGNALHIISRGEKDASSDTKHLVHETVIQPVSSVESFKVGGNSEAEGVVKKVSQEVSKELGGCPVFRDSLLKDSNAETILPNSMEEETTIASYEDASLNVPEQISNKGEVSTLPVPSSPNDSGQEVKQTSSLSGEHKCGQIAVPRIGGDAWTASEGSLSTACLPESKSTVREGGNGSEESENPNCGSPTVISCVDPQHENELQEGDKGPAGENLVICVVNGGATCLQHEKELQEGDKGPAGENLVVCGVKDSATRGACSVSPDLKGNDPSKDDKSFTFEITPLPDLPERVAGKSWQAFSTIQAGQISGIVEGSYSSTLSQMDSKLEHETTGGNPLTSDSQIVRGGSKSTGRKARRASGKAMGKEATKKVNYLKEASPGRQSERGDKPSVVSPIQSATSQLQQSEGMLYYGHVEHGGTKPSGALNTGTSNLPDLNALASATVVYQQPFTDMQQLQLRAQIFVYGSLILGAAPDEACMVTAFGASDGMRSIWENAWHAFVERMHNQKSHPNNPETPSPSCSGARPLNLASKHGALRNKVISTPVGRASNKLTLSPVLNSMIALSSPLWSISTPSPDGLQPSTAMPRGAALDYHQPLSPLQTYQSPPLQNFVGHTSWLSQAPFPVPWIASHQTSALDASARFSTLPITETVRLNPVRELSAPHSSGLKHVSHSLMTPSGAPGGAFAGICPPVGIKMAPVSPGHHSADLKPRKRKKIPVSEELSHAALPSASIVTTGSACSMLKTDSHEVIAAVSPSSTPVNVKTGNQDAEQSIALSEETLHNVKEAKLQAEKAAAHAAATVAYVRGMWTQLDKEKNSGLVSDVEAALTSAAVAVAAAASIAKAAAAAAQIASNAALQAKLMADEALVASCNGNLGQSTGSASSVIGAAREAARKRVEAASAASKQAENFDALVKAAELVAEAVSQAGKVVAMGDPLPLSHLVEAGPEGCWKLPQVSSDPVVKSNYVKGGQQNVDSVEKGLDNFAECSEKPVARIEMQTTSYGKPLNSEGELRGQEGCKGPDSAKTIGVVPESEFGSRSDVINAPNGNEKAVDTLKEGSIKEGSLVEVFKDGHAIKAAWYLAKVLSLEEGKACVCYTELTSEDGLGQLKEWVVLEGEGDKAPRIRIARPMTSIQVEGTRKRQRTAMGECTWCVGDRVDAWIRTCWCEGVVTETDKKDRTALTVSFPADGEPSVIRAWHLRPSLIWKDGDWIEWSSSRKNDSSSHEGDSPREKRPRLASPAVEAVGEDKLSKSTDVVESGKPEDSKLLALSANEKIFDVGKASRDGSKPNRLKTVQAGLRKDGPGAKFGVPKPGKKRKFMEVSKHYVAGLSNKTNQVSDSAKCAKILMPQGSGSRGASRIEVREKRAPESKLKPVKVQNISSRSVTQKNKLSTSEVFAPCEGTLTNDLANIEDSDSHNEFALGKRNPTGFGSFANARGGAAGGPFLFSSSSYTQDVPLSKKVSTSNAKPERGNKGKLAPSDGKLARIVEDKVFTSDTGKTTSEVIEPRRSNRRIQPTSRLLEGLQSSMVISKFPSVSHDRTHKIQNRSVYKGSNRG